MLRRNVLAWRRLSILNNFTARIQFHKTAIYNLQLTLQTTFTIHMYNALEKTETHNVLAFSFSCSEVCVLTQVGLLILN